MLIQSVKWMLLAVDVTSAKVNAFSIRKIEKRSLGFGFGRVEYRMLECVEVLPERGLRSAGRRT